MSSFIHKKLAPVKVAVLPLSKKDQLIKAAKEILFDLKRAGLVTDYDDTQSIGRRYRRQDEIGTPYCITFDFESVSDQKVTVRDRDSMKQDRVAIAELSLWLKENLGS